MHLMHRCTACGCSCTIQEGSGAQALGGAGGAAQLAEPLTARLGPLLAGEYICEDVLLPWLLELQLGPEAAREEGLHSAGASPEMPAPALQAAVHLLAQPLGRQRVRSPLPLS